MDGSISKEQNDSADSRGVLQVDEEHKLPSAISMYSSS